MKVFNRFINLLFLLALGCASAAWASSDIAATVLNDEAKTIWSESQAGVDCDSLETGAIGCKLGLKQDESIFAEGQAGALIPVISRASFCVQLCAKARDGRYAQCRTVQASKMAACNKNALFNHFACVLNCRR